MVSVRKVQVEQGVQICGGNLCGIFVKNLEEDSPAKLVDVLMPGDMIVEVSCLWSYSDICCFIFIEVNIKRTWRQ